jgi:hypothetical protein
MSQELQVLQANGYVVATPFLPGSHTAPEKSDPSSPKATV